MGQHWTPDSDDERMIKKAVKQGREYSERLRGTFTPSPQQSSSTPAEPEPEPSESSSSSESSPSPSPPPPPGPSLALNESPLPIRPPPPVQTRDRLEQGQESLFLESVQWVEKDSRARKEDAILILLSYTPG